MGRRMSRRAWKSRAAPFLLFSFFLVGTLLTACREAAAPGEPGTGVPAGRKPAVVAPQRPDPALNRLFARIAGLPGRAAGGEAWPEEPSWTSFSALAGREWTSFDTTVLDPMKHWAEVELREVRKSAASLFYPFGGPDFVTSDALFPEARETILIGLEPVGNLPDLDGEPAAWREGFFTDLGELISGFLQRGYFITHDMNDIYSRGKVDGALPVIAFFLGRERLEVVEIKRLSPDPGGGWIETPYAPLEDRPHRPYGVRIAYLRPGEAKARSVVYFSCDVEDKAFPPGSVLYRFLAGLDRMTTFVKSGSYLLHWGNFSILRNFILDRSLYLLEDDTAVPYRFLKDGGWAIKLYGRYGPPVKDFENVEQPDLKQAYEEGGSAVAPLPFHFGYHWRTKIDNLILAKRPRRPYKVPVLH